MVCNSDFLRVYNETFKFIDEKLGTEGVEEYWKRISPIALWDLQQVVEEHGLDGCWQYWDRVLTKEGASFNIKFKENVFTLNILVCPSLKILDDPYRDYCRHCKVMYECLFDKLGFIYRIKGNGKGCRITVTK